MNNGHGFNHSFLGQKFMYDQCVSVFTVKRFHIKATKTDED